MQIMELKEKIERFADRQLILYEPTRKEFESELKSLLETMIDNYNKWLLDHGYTDFDIISEFDMDDYFNDIKTIRMNTADIKKHFTKWFYWWWNQPGQNTEEGFDKWLETGEGEDFKKAMESYAKEHAIETTLQYYKWTKFGKHNDIILREHIEQWYTEYFNQQTK